ncbi:hypothetical protein NQ318_005919 [Aromia moschata]|uniref:Uncharacterized protein n=1 Tax=Aromia moschata TaxID=1265417 RepID=A0AAV8XGR8_9CUCU|nr:hypothetical protein NQ318_005919 [Aromia moschata]
MLFLTKQIQDQHQTSQNGHQLPTISNRCCWVMTVLDISKEIIHNFLLLMEKTRMHIFKRNLPRGTCCLLRLYLQFYGKILLRCENKNYYIPVSWDLEIQAILLDRLMDNPEKPRDFQRQPLKEMNLTMADACFVRSRDYSKSLIC